MLWTAGITPAPLRSTLPCTRGRGRVVADDRFQVPGWANVWALCDCSIVRDPLNPGKFHPPSAQHAIREAAVVASNIVAAMQREIPQPFTFRIVFSKEIVQTPTVRSPSMSEAEESSTVEEKKKLA